MLAFFLLAHHSGWALLPYFAWGAVGALLAGCCKTGRIQLPRMSIEKLKDGSVRRFLDLGFLSTCLFGGYLAAAIDGRPFTAAMTGIAVAYLGREILKPLVELWLRRFTGVTIAFHPPTPIKEPLPNESR